MLGNHNTIIYYEPYHGDVVYNLRLWILNFSAEKHVFAQSNENWDDGPNWKIAVKKIEELEKLVKIQDERISILEKGSTLSKLRSIAELQETVQIQNNRIIKLETRISELEAMVKEQEPEAIDIETSEKVSEVKLNMFTPKRNFIRKGIFAENNVCSVIYCIMKTCNQRMNK